MMLTLARLVARGYRKLRLISLGGQRSWQRVASGFGMYIDPDDITDQGFLFGTYERALVRCVYHLVEPGEIAIDVGAEKGYMTLHFARAVTSRGRVIAFEPDLRAAKELVQNCARNGVDSIISLLPYALSDEEGTCELALTKQIGNSSRFPNEFAQRQVVSRASVSSKTLDQVLEELGISPKKDMLSFIKIDAEGSEPLILAGASGALGRFSPAVWLEINRPSLRAGGFSSEMIGQTLRKAGYHLYRVSESRDRFLRLGFCLTVVSNLDQERGELFDILAVPVHSTVECRFERLIRSYGNRCVIRS